MNDLFKTADLYDEHYDRLQVCLPLLRHFRGRRSFQGQIRTLKCYEDNSLVAELLAEAGLGQVLVVDGGGSLHCALLGDRLAQKAVDNGWSGVVIYGCLRDAADIKKMPLGALALATNPRKSVKQGTGQKDVTLHFANVSFRPGEWLYADEDGVVVSSTRLG